MTNSACTAVVQNAKPTSFRELPALAAEHDTPDFCSVLLFYQYVEPLWSSSQHRRALRKLMEVCQECKVTGRGRVAPEGLNCTLTGHGRSIRKVCQGLREFDKIFWETDFKITDGVPVGKQFKSLSVRKTEELVAYGLKGEAIAPSLNKFAGTHLEADEYHDALQDPNAVVIDVRNFYETKLGAFNPPPGGAKLIDPKLRNSVEFPRWLAAPETQQELDGKKVLMYCTGGIRCERATALLNEMVAASQYEETVGGKEKDDINQQEKTEKGVIATKLTCKPKGVFELRGGIERYVKTFPKGGFWKGKNYLFDRRMEQIPEGRNISEVEEEIDAQCCLCRRKWTVYRGQYNCSSKLCGVPVIVCNGCTQHADQSPHELQCDLCQENYRLSVAQPDLALIKRKAEEKSALLPHKKARQDDAAQREHYPDRLFVSCLPLTATVTKLKELLLPNPTSMHPSREKDKDFWVHWLTDPNTKAFYGSCIVQMPNSSMAKEVVGKAVSSNGKDQKKGLRIDKKRIKVTYVWKKTSTNGKSKIQEDVFKAANFQSREYPPIQ